MKKLKKRSLNKLKNQSSKMPLIPDWHIELVNAELEMIKNGTANLIDWDVVKTQLES